MLDAARRGDGATTQALMAEVNLGTGRIEAMLKVLDVEGAVARDGTRWLARPGSDWHYDAERYARITALRRREQAAMAQLGADGRCLMRALQEELDDPAPQDCGRCAVCAGPRFDGPLDPELVREAALHLRSRPLVLEVKKMAPDAEGAMRKIPEDVRAEEGRALARLGDGGWDPLVQAGRSAGRFDDELVDAAAELVRRWGIGPRGSPPIPSLRTRRARAGFAARLAERARASPFARRARSASTTARRSARWPTPHQQAANVRGALRGHRRAAAGRRACSSTTSASAAGRWRWSPASCAASGAEAVYPLALSTAF